MNKNIIIGFNIQVAYVKWEKYEGINEYPGNLNTDLRKVALSTALCILYASQGQRDNYCAAIAGVLLKHTNWSEEEINEFVYNVALESDDNEAEKRKSKCKVRLSKERQEALQAEKLRQVFK